MGSTAHFANPVVRGQKTAPKHLATGRMNLPARRPKRGRQGFGDDHVSAHAQNAVVMCSLGHSGEIHS